MREAPHKENCLCGGLPTHRNPYVGMSIQKEFSLWGGPHRRKSLLWELKKQKKLKILDPRFCPSHNEVWAPLHTDSVLGGPPTKRIPCVEASPHRNPCVGPLGARILDGVFFSFFIFLAPFFMYFPLFFTGKANKNAFI